MKIIIAGSRNIDNPVVLGHCLAQSSFKVFHVIHGGCPRGVDALAAQWAALNEVPCDTYPADWTKYGKAAGPIRNRQMAEAGDALIAIWDGSSPGTEDMIRQMDRLGKLVEVYLVGPPPRQLDYNQLVQRLVDTE